MVFNVRRVLWTGILAALSAPYGWTQANSVTCGVTAVPPLVRAEGLAERLGDILLNCKGRPGDVVSGNLTVSLNTTLTNRISNGKLDVALTLDTGVGPTLLAMPELLGTNRAVFAGITFAVGSSGVAELRITNLRGDATQSTVGSMTLQATLAFNPPSVLSMSGNQAVIGVPQRGLLATTALASIANQIGSPVPEELSFMSLLAAGTRFSSTRVTEGFPGAFEPRSGSADTGTRIVLRFTGNPPEARLFAPSVIVGSNGTQATAAGDFGGTVSGGQYGATGLALVRVQGHAADGSGGFLLPLPTPGQGTLNAVQEIPISNGTGIAVYEVANAIPAAIETAQIPVFLGLPPMGEARTLVLTREVFFGPISSVATASTNQPVPRFKPVTTSTDCTSSSDCGLYLPKLQAYPQHTSFVAVSGVNYQMIFIPIENVGGGVMAWSTRIEYKHGSDWLRVSPTSGLQSSNLRLDVIPMGLAVGKYEATLVIDAGPAGIARYPVTLDVRPLPVPMPTISSIGGAATFSGPLTRGGLATIKGSNLAGQSVSVTFDGKPARILYSSAEQINFQVPADLAGTSARVVVTANAVPSAAQTVELAPVAPGIFPGGILNQDNRVNAPETAAASPSIVQIFATGLLPAEGDARVEAQLGETYYSGSDLPYAGQAPGLSGVQQVNFRIPSGLATGTADLRVCATPAGGVRVCSPAVRLFVRGE